MICLMGCGKQRPLDCVEDEIFSKFIENNIPRESVQIKIELADSFEKNPSLSCNVKSYYLEKEETYYLVCDIWDFDKKIYGVDLPFIIECSPELVFEGEGVAELYSYSRNNNWVFENTIDAKTYKKYVGFDGTQVFEHGKKVRILACYRLTGKAIEGVPFIFYINYNES